MTTLKRIDRERLEIVDIDGRFHHVWRSGLMFAYSGSVPETIIDDGSRIPDFGRNLKRPAGIMQRVVRCGSSYETRFDAAHGRRYFLCVYGGEPFSFDRVKQRRVAIAAADGIRNLREYQISAGVLPEEPDAIASRERGE